MPPVYEWPDEYGQFRLDAERKKTMNDPEQLIEFMQVALDGLRELAKTEPTVSISINKGTLYTLYWLAAHNPNETLAEYTRAAINAEIEAME